MAKKKEEWLAKLRGITTTDQNIDTPSTLTSNSTAKKKKKIKIKRRYHVKHLYYRRWNMLFFYFSKSV
jgi:hypothetical protein